MDEFFNKQKKLRSRYIKYVPPIDEKDNILIKKKSIEKIASPPSSSPLCRIKSYEDVPLQKKNIIYIIKSCCNCILNYLNTRSNNSWSNIHRN